MHCAPAAAVALHLWTMMLPLFRLMLVIAIATQAPVKADEIDDVIRAISHRVDTSCDDESDALRSCLTLARSPGLRLARGAQRVSTGQEDDVFECPQCMTAGLDTTLPIVCPALAAPTYCATVRACVNQNCAQECHDAYYASVNCAIQACKDANACGEEVPVTKTPRV